MPAVVRFGKSYWSCSKPRELPLQGPAGMGHVKWIEGLREIAEDYDVWSSGVLAITQIGVSSQFREGERYR